MFFAIAQHEIGGRGLEPATAPTPRAEAQCKMASLSKLPWGVLIVVGLVVTPAAQQSQLAFEVASIKRSLPGSPGGSTGDFRGRGGMFRVTKMSLQGLVLAAYGIRKDQLIGGPDWMRRDLFDVSAKAAAEVPRDRILLMLQSLLEDRFGLVVNRERRERDVYALKLARSDGRLGPDLRKVADDCRQNFPSIGPEFIARMPISSSGARPSFLGACAPMASVVRVLERILQTTVIDETQLTGMWNYVVAHGGFQATTSIGPNTDVEDRPSLFAALQEQLGLRLERQRGPVDVVVITAVHQPTEN